MRHPPLEIARTGEMVARAYAGQREKLSRTANDPTSFRIREGQEGQKGVVRAEAAETVICGWCRGRNRTFGGLI